MPERHLGNKRGRDSPVRDAGTRAVIEGTTTIEELFRVTRDDAV
jgi:hypothetical protein